MNCRARTKEAEKAREAYSKFIRDRTLPNLWTVHPPFQIDGSLGAMAGVAEMLLQSHEGYIEPLPAVPARWNTGQFKGLMARGNFEISAEWENGIASNIDITSRKGGECTIKYAGISSCIMEDDRGNPITYAQNSHNSITFNTEKNKTYYIKMH